MIRATTFRCLMRRHPLARVALTVFSLILIGLFSVVAVAIGAVVLTVWLLRRALSGNKGIAQPLPQQSDRTMANGDVIEGEYRVIQHRNSQWTSPT